MAASIPVYSLPQLTPAAQLFDLKGQQTRWQILADIHQAAFAFEILPGVFAQFGSTGARRFFRNSYFEIFELVRITHEREKVQDQLVSLAGVLTLKPEAV